MIFTCEFAFHQGVQINEVVSSNTESLFDEDGDSPDWIELYNPSDQTAFIAGLNISDDRNDLSKWSFPDISIGPNEYFIVFASSKDRKDYVVQWDAKIDWGDYWSFWVGTSEPIEDWEKPETYTGFWSVGSSGFGYGDNDDNTQIQQTNSVYAKKGFIIEDLSKIAKVLFHIDYDDGYVAYLNGNEFSRKNLGEPGSELNYFTTSTDLHEAELYNDQILQYIEIDLQNYPIYEGVNTLAVEVHNYSSNSSDLTCIPFLTLGYNTENNSASARLPHQLLKIPSTYVHTNFKISSSGEHLLLSSSDETILDSIFVPEMDVDISYGRLSESNSWAMFATASPGEANSFPSYVGALSKPTLYPNSGFFNSSPVRVQISHPNPNSLLYYTTDGTAPTTQSTLYNQDDEIVLFSTTVIRANAFLDGWISSKSVSKTYIFETDNAAELPKIFLTTDPNSFFDTDTGMYVFGPNASWDFPHFGANFWEDWERKIHFEILETNGSGYSANAGAKIFGGWSRGFPQKSLSIFARSAFGPSSFEYKLFPATDINSYEAFVVRNSGNDWTSTLIRDGFLTSLTNNLDIDHQRYRPAVLYINGEFWGIQNIREKVNEHFISSHHSVLPEDVDLLELNGVNDGNIIHGTNTDYRNLINYLLMNDISTPSVQNAIDNWIDIKSYMAYQSFQIFIDNRDWPGNNIKFWRDHYNDSKWRWILYDTDFGFGIWDPNAYTFNTLSFALQDDGPGWPNPPWSTFLFRKLMENNHFKNIFINTFCDLLNTVLKPENISFHLDSVSSRIANTVGYHQERWYNNGLGANSAVNWENDIANMENFGIQRGSYVIEHLKNEFNLSELNKIKLNIEPELAGSININSLEIENTNWQGHYFPSIPINIKAIQKDGYEFSHWQEYPDSSREMKIELDDSLSLTAIFIPSQLSPGKIVINEINYNSHDSHDTGDWIELFNAGESEIDITNWVMKDDNNDHAFILSENTIIESGGYFIIAQRPSDFLNFFVSTMPLAGPFNFGFSGGGDEIRIFNDQGMLIDSVKYDDSDPWPIEPDGGGHTLELINPSYDNSLAISWSSSQNYGSPSEQNTNYFLEQKFVKSVPLKACLLPAYPNPFNASVTIGFELATTKGAFINIYNVLGQLILEFPLDNYPIGKSHMTWKGKNQLGQEVSNGVYFVRLSTQKGGNLQKILYLK